MRNRLILTLVFLLTIGIGGHCGGSESLKVNFKTGDLAFEFREIESKKTTVNYSGVTVFEGRRYFATSDPPYMVLESGVCRIDGVDYPLDVSGLANCWVLDEETPISPRFVRTVDLGHGVRTLGVCFAKGGAEDYLVE